MSRFNMTNNNVPHDYNKNVESIISIHGYVPEGITDRYISGVLSGLSQYAKKHLCDFGQTVLHDNYLYGKNTEIDIKIDKDKIYFYAKVDGFVKDLDLIIDHLRSPYSNNDDNIDGFSMYNFSYTIEQRSKNLDYGPEKYYEGVFDRIEVFDDQNNFLYTKNEKINK